MLGAGDQLERMCRKRLGRRARAVDPCGTSADSPCLGGERLRVRTFNLRAFGPCVHGLPVNSDEVSGKYVLARFACEPDITSEELEDSLMRKETSTDKATA